LLENSSAVDNNPKLYSLWFRWQLKAPLLNNDEHCLVTLWHYTNVTTRVLTYLFSPDMDIKSFISVSIAY